MYFQQIRNATIKIQYAGKQLLFDPWLQSKGEMGTLQGYPVPDPEMAKIPNPMTDLPIPIKEILSNVDAYIVTHVHPDHFDMDTETTGGKRLNKTTPIFVQSKEDKEYMKHSGFINSSILSEHGNSFGEITLIKTPGCHGTKIPCGPSSGVILKHEEEPTVYIVGDTIWYPEVEQVIRTHQPNIIILNASAAEFIDNGRLIMDDNDLYQVYQTAPNAVIIASHMDAVSHSRLTRKTLKEKLNEKGILNQIRIPEDGETYCFSKVQ